MRNNARASGYLVLVVARDGTRLYSPNLKACVGRHAWRQCGEGGGKGGLREVFGMTEDEVTEAIIAGALGES